MMRVIHKYLSIDWNQHLFQAIVNQITPIDQVRHRLHQGNSRQRFKHRLTVQNGIAVAVDIKILIFRVVVPSVG